MKAKEIIKLIEDIDKSDKDHNISYHIEIINTGITEKEPDPLSKWKEYEDLGGRKYIITIEKPNDKP